METQAAYCAPASTENSCVWGEWLTLGVSFGCSHPLVLQGNLLLTGDKDQLVMLLDQINSTFVRSNPSVLQGLLRIIPYLSFGEVEKMQILVERFKPYCSFDKYEPAL